MAGSTHELTLPEPVRLREDRIRSAYKLQRLFMESPTLDKRVRLHNFLRAHQRISYSMILPYFLIMYFRFVLEIIVDENGKRFSKKGCLIV